MTTTAPSDGSQAADAHATTTAEAPAWRTVLGGFLMGLANLVPGVSGGTMILALGLYDRFISSVAELTSLRWSKQLFVFLTLVGGGLVIALLSMSGPAVWLVSEHRWIAYSLFVGLTLGGVPELLKLCGGLRPAAMIAAAVGFAGMFALANSSASSVPPTLFNLAWIGAIAASSMILPGVSGSYLLLIFGLYETVVGSLSLLKEEPVEAVMVLAPVGVGAALGIAALSNVLKVALEKRPVSSHGLLLGLLVGSVVGLWPFQEAVHPELAQRETRKAIELVVLDGADAATVNAERGLEWTEAEVTAARATYGGKTKNELKAMSNELRRFGPAGGQIGGSLALLVLGFASTLLLGRGRGAKDQ